MARAVQRGLNWIQLRYPKVDTGIRRFVRLSMWDLHYGVSEAVCGLSALIVLSAVAIGIDGWTTGNERYWFIVGVVLMISTVLQQRVRGKTLIQLYRIYKRDEGSQVESRNMAFDIRESYIDRILSVLNEDYPGTVVYGRYFTPQGRNTETSKFSLGQIRNWENRANKRIRSLCFAWQHDVQRFRIEYRRTPAQIYADRFIETTGLEETAHIRLREIIAQEEWACRPRFEWVTKMGLYWSILIAATIIFLFLGHPTLYLSSDEPSSMSGFTLIARVLFVESLIIIAVSAVVSSVRAYYFPSGILRIDEEIDEQKGKDAARARFANWAFLAILGLVGVLMVEPVLQMCSTEQSGGLEFFEKLRWQFTESPVCKYIVPNVLK